MTSPRFINDTRKYCEDCRWYKPYEHATDPKDRADLSECTKPMPGTSLISKSLSKTQQYKSCQVLRSIDWIAVRLVYGGKVCGREGRFWEPK